MAWDAATSTLLFGERDAVLIDALTTSAEAEALADWVGLHHRNLTTIHIAQGHVDHFTWLSVLLQRVPEAGAIATPESAELARRQSSRLPFFRGLWPGHLPAAVAFPEPYERDVFTLEDYEVRILRRPSGVASSRRLGRRGRSLERLRRSWSAKSPQEVRKPSPRPVGDQRQTPRSTG